MKNIGLMAKASAAALVLAAGLMTGCDSNGGGSSSKTGVFHDAVVSGISYTASPSGLEGVTDAEGKFKYKTGDTITFSIGGIVFPGGIPQDGIITPAHLAGTEDWETDATAINIIRFLMTIDEDGDATNGIQIPEGAADLAVDEIDFSDTGAFDTAADAFFDDLVLEIDFTYTALVTAGDAEIHFQGTIDDLGITIEIQILAGACSNTNTADVQGTWTGSLTGTLGTPTYLGSQTIVVDGTDLTIGDDSIDAVSCTYANTVTNVVIEVIIDTWTWTDGTDTYSISSSTTEDVTTTTFTVTEGSTAISSGSISQGD